MNGLVIADLHACSSYPMSTLLPNGRPRRFQALLDVLAQVERLLDEDVRTRPADLLILGDIFHKRTFVRFSLFNEVYDALYRLAEQVKQTTILVGNHDIESDSEADGWGAAHALHALGGLPNAVVVDQPRTVTLADGEEAYAIPYSYNTSAVVRAFEQAPTLPVLAHFLADGMPVREDWAIDGPLKLGELDRFPLALFGHVHKPSELRDGKVVVVGAIMPHDFGDEGPRGALRVRGTRWTRIPLASPAFQTCAWPRLPTPPPAPGGYLRILAVPEGKLIEARETALELKWIDAVAVPATLPEEVRETLSSGLLVTESLIGDHVRRRCPDLPEDQQRLLIDEGVAVWKEAQN